MKLLKYCNLKILINFIIVIILLFINLNCGNKIKSNGYKKIKGENFVKIDYSNYIERLSNNEINLSFIEYPHTLNPYRAATKSEFFFSKALFSSLFYLDPDTGSPEKNLIDKVIISNDGLEYYFILKDNIKFNNRSNLNSEDVVFSLELLNSILKDTEIYKNFFILNQELKIELVSSHEFKILLDIPNSNLLYALSNYPIIPKDVAKSISENIEVFINYWELKPDMDIIGSGPYKIDELTDENIILTKNNYYFKKDQNNNPLPYSSTINVNFFHNKNNEIFGFLNNETDIISINIDDYNLLTEYFKQNNDIKIRFIETNLSKNMVTVAYNCFREDSKSFLKDNEFRKYLSYFIKKSVDNKDENLKDYIADKNLFKDLNHDNILEYKDGNTVFIRILAIKEEKEIVNIAKKLKEILEGLNFEVYLEIVPLQFFLEKMFINFDYDIGIFYYKFDPGIISYYQLLSKDGLSFYPYVYDNNKSSEMVFKGLEKCIFTKSDKSLKEELKKLKSLLNDMNQLFTIYTQNEYYLTKLNIYNLKINSSIEDGYNLKTIETIINTEFK